MKLTHIPLDRIGASKANMRCGRRLPDLSDILPSIRARGVLVPVLVRIARPANDNASPDGGAPEHYEVVAGWRRFLSACTVRDETGDDEPLPCAILDDDDDAAALEASLIENVARRDPDEVSQWETFAALIKQGRGVDDLAMTFGFTVASVKRIFALGNLLPRIRSLYRAEEIDRPTIRQLTMATKAQQKAWLALYDDPDRHCPSGWQLKAWLFGGAEIKTEVALFDLDSYTGGIVGDLFGEDRYFADAEAFWAAQETAIAARIAQYRADGWADVVVLPRDDYFASYDYTKTTKRRGGRVYVTTTRRGDVTFHEGYVTAKEARRIDSGGSADAPKAVRPELSGPLQTYVDLHRHAAVRASMLFHPHLALRAMVAHVIAGSPYWSVRADPQTSRNEATRESVETSRAETAFDERRRAVLALLGADPDAPTVLGSDGDGGAAGILLRLVDLPDAAVFDVIAVVMGESLANGSVETELLGDEIGVGMACWWQPDAAFFDLLRDKAVLGALVADVAGETVANANAGEKGKVLKQIVVDHIEGNDGRAKAEQWVPRWMAFPPAAYTTRGGVGPVQAHWALQRLRADAASIGQQSADILSLPAPAGTDALKADRQEDEDAATASIVPDTLAA